MTTRVGRLLGDLFGGFRRPRQAEHIVSRRRWLRFRLGLVLCDLHLHHWSPPRADGYERSTCERCGRPWRDS